MLAIILQIIIGMLGGISAAFQAQFSGFIGQRLGELESVFFTYTGGGMVIAVIIFLFRGGGNLAGWQTLPWYVFLGGPLGLVIIGSLSFTVPRLGSAAAVTLFVTAWLTLNALMDHYGMFGVVQRSLDIPRLAGMAILFLGTWLTVR